MNRVWPFLLLALPCYSQMTQAPTLPVTDTSIRPQPELFASELRAAFKPLRGQQ